MEGSDLYLDPAPASSAAALPGDYADGFWAMGDTITWVFGLVADALAVHGLVLGLRARRLAVGDRLAYRAPSASSCSSSGSPWSCSSPRARGASTCPGRSRRASSCSRSARSAPCFVLIRVIRIPEAVLPADSRGIGIWIALIASLGVIAGGLLRAAEDF